MYVLYVCSLHNRWWSVIDDETGKMSWKFEAWTPEERQVAYTSQVSRGSGQGDQPRALFSGGDPKSWK